MEELGKKKNILQKEVALKKEQLEEIRSSHSQHKPEIYHGLNENNPSLEVNKDLDALKQLKQQTDNVINQMNIQKEKQKEIQQINK